MEKEDPTITKRKSLKRRMLYGAVLAAILLVIAFAIGATPHPGKELLDLILIPAIMVPIAGAAGGAVFHFTRPMAEKGTWQKVLAYIISLLAFLLFILTAFGLAMSAGN